MFIMEGKSYQDISELKADFLKDNRTYLDDNLKIAATYQKQPIRISCKICGKMLHRKKSFFSHEIEYIVCENCGHINGAYEETLDFTTQIYEQFDYGKNYRMLGKEAYQNRMNKIYVPKANFLIQTLQDESVCYKNLKCLDVGTGSGYFVGAMELLGLNACGIDVSKRQVSWGNEMLGSNRLRYVTQKEVPECIRATDASIVSFIGVLEHVINLEEVLDAVAANNNIRYVLFSVPLFSYSVVLEAISPNVFNRLLGGSHTHIFTNESLKYLYKKYGWDVIGEWWFGTDAADLLRCVIVKLESEGNSYLAEVFHDKYARILDSIQIVLDKEHFCSEVHVVVRKQDTDIYTGTIESPEKLV